ncbi:MAG: GTP cyclohydrolase, FolE2/MptA family [Thermoplasmataceae archaeon]
MRPEKGQSESKPPQDEKPSRSIPLDKAGILNYKLPLKLIWNDILQETIATVSADVEVPKERRGAHFSKILSSMILGFGNPGGDIIDMVHRTASNILQENPYSSKTTVKLETTYLMPHVAVSGLVSHIPYNFEFSTLIYRSGTCTDSVTLETTAMTACPCTMEGTRRILSERYPEYSVFIQKVPIITHSQRNRLRVSIRTSEKCGINPLALIKSVESVTGGPLISVLPKRDSDEFVVKVHENPYFVEDLVREIAYTLGNDLKGIPGNALLLISSRSEESLHNHDAYAELELTMDEIKEKSRKK